NIQNYGVADARSGNADAGGLAARAAQTTASAASTAAGNAATGGTTSGGSVGSAARARGGDAVAIANSVDAAVVSQQLSSANGSHALSSSAVVSMLRELPPGSWSPFVERNLPAENVPAVQAGLASNS